VAINRKLGFADSGDNNSLERKREVEKAIKKRQREFSLLIFLDNITYYWRVLLKKAFFIELKF